jgi:hypothetical protein
MSQFKKAGEYVVMADGAFAICPEKVDGFVPFAHRDSIELYIRCGLQLVDSPLKQLIEDGFIVEDGKLYKIVRRVGGLDTVSKYHKYTFFRPLVDKRKYLAYRQPVEDGRSINENDCLKFAEAISIAANTGRKALFQKMIRADTSPPVYQAKDMPVLFGETDAKNQRLLTKVVMKNDKASPSAGEAYAIVRRTIVVGSAPYHIAYVLYSNNGVNITLEANADSGAEYYPRFGFYDTKKTFHGVFSDTAYTNGTTIVLQNRPISDFLREFSK